MAKKPEPPKPTRWTVYELAAKAERLGTVEAPDEATLARAHAAAPDPALDPARIYREVELS